MSSKKQILSITGMHCTSCAMNIDGELEDTAGVQSAITNYAKQQTIVEYDELQISLLQIQEIIKRLGYSAVV